jgi:diacylglycerol kinase family enzyme
LLWNVPRLVIGWLPTGNPRLWRGRCRNVQVRCEAPLPFHIDGELFSDPDRPVHTLDVQILPGALRVMAKAPPSASNGSAR